MVRLRLETDTPGFFGDICEVVRLFWPGAAIALDQGERVLRHTHQRQGDQWIERWQLGVHQALYQAPVVEGGLAEKRCLKRAVKTGCFLLMRQMTGVNPPWGSLTGIRPTRLLYEALGQGMSLEEGTDWLCRTFFVSPDKALLLRDILAAQQGLVEPGPGRFDVYVGIPFCVTRCAYCSFASGELGDGQLVESYLEALLREMEACARLTASLGLSPRAFYMGGGTPTALTAAQLSRVLEAARRLFPGCVEWTVEAGRPDTIQRDKLLALKAAGVGRISVNPQSFSDETLARIGRAHTAAETVRAFALAREMGFDNINMDLIAALPGEDLSAFAYSLDRCLALAPESVTVHTLAIKRSSRLHEAGYTQSDSGAAAQMVNLARSRLAGAGYQPYYLYRQKYMADNLENVGYALPGRACLYNIGNMEETAPVLALGAGAITKWLFPRERRIERAPNVKNIQEYIARVDEMVQRKYLLIEGGTHP